MPRAKAPLLLMSYLEPAARARGGSARHIGRAGRRRRLHRPGSAFDESAELRAALQAQGLALVQMVTPVTQPQRLEQICASSQGFVYAVTMTGTTGKSVAVPPEVTRISMPCALCHPRPCVRASASAAASSSICCGITSMAS